MTTPSILLRRWPETFLWTHSAAFNVIVVLSFLLLMTGWNDGIRGPLIRLLVCAIAYFVGAAPAALNVAYKHRVIPSRWVATYPLIAVVMAILCYVLVLTDGPAQTLGYFLMGLTGLYIAAGAMITFALSIFALGQLTRELRRPEVLQLGCGGKRHPLPPPPAVTQQENIVLMQQAPDAVPQPEVAP